MKILLDTHILISTDPDRIVDRHLPEAIQCATELGHKVVIHRTSVEQLEKDKNIPESKKRVLRWRKDFYPIIHPQSDPYDNEDFWEKIHKPDTEREEEDIYLLYCLYEKEVDLLLTEDSDIYEKAVLLGISGKVKNVRQAAESFKRALNETKPEFADVPIYCFYKEGTMWHIGQKGKKLSAFHHQVGFDRIHVLLEHENDPIPCDILLTGGKIVGDDFYHRLSHEDWEILGLHVDTGVRYDPRISKNRRNIRAMIVKLKEDLGGDLPLEEKSEKERLLEKLEKWQNMKYSEPHSPAGQARTPVFNSIKRVIEKIKKDASLSIIADHLDHSIEGGYEPIYLPRTSKPKWILDPDSE